ncbi:alpha/beta fold hydrolase [Kitasatospora sp. NPDC057940]|uniref:alpha/beta fold hydrolase n=1 Tax=Kitasatospora sp. NPDC057940 TaxID=3346285 RepID=UPI0036DE22AE
MPAPPGFWRELPQFPIKRRAVAEVIRSVHEWTAERLSYYEVAPERGITQQARVIVMHGGGPRDSKEPSLPLAQDLAALGYHVLGFDFTGSGDSSGAWPELTLDRRRDQAVSLVDDRVPAQCPLILVGFSMSGQTAADLVEHYGERVSHLALCAPGVYSRTLRETPFGDDTFINLAFTKPELWPGSPALDVLAAFPGRTLLVLPEHEEQVPPGMADLIERTVRTNPRSAIQVLDGAGHLLDRWLAEHPQDRRSVIKNLLRRPTAAWLDPEMSG